MKTSQIEKTAMLEIGKLLKKRRAFLRLTQLDIAEGLGYKSTNFISMIEKGAYKVPLAQIDKYALQYNFEPAAFKQFVLKRVFPEIWDVVKSIIASDINIHDTIVRNEVNFKNRSKKAHEDGFFKKSSSKVL